MDEKTALPGMQCSQLGRLLQLVGLHAGNETKVIHPWENSGFGKNQGAKFKV